MRREVEDSPNRCPSCQRVQLSAEICEKCREDARKWVAIEYGYEKISIQDERGTEIGFVHRRRDADLIIKAIAAYKE